MYPELEITLSRRGRISYTAVFRFRDIDSAVEQRFEVRSIRLDVEVFAADILQADSKSYGIALGKALFSAPEAAAAFQAARNSASLRNIALRIRLCVDDRSLKLHRLRWEQMLIADPADPSRVIPLCGTSELLFSRHLFSSDMRTVRLRAKQELSSLIVLASPTDVQKYSDGSGRPLAEIVAEGPDGALTIAREGLVGLKQDLITANGAGRATLSRILDGLRAEPDILYMSCHGALIDNEPQLLLEKEDGTGAVISGEELIETFRGLRTLPRLVILMSCQSAGTAIESTDGEAVLAALGPKLAEAGVAAVLAMQGDLDKATARRFLPSFFKELNSSGRVDAAVTAGRIAVLGAADSWVFVLYTRLVEGQIWFAKGLTAIAAQTDFAWSQLASDISRGKCVPVLGPGVLEPFLGSTREVAVRLAMNAGYPHGLGGREDLPQVAQFLETMRGKKDPQVQLPVLTAMAEAVGDRFPELSSPVGQLDPGRELRTRLKKAWALYSKDRPFEPHRYLASHPEFKTLITVNPDDLLQTAFQGRDVNVHVCDWSPGAGLYGRASQKTRISQDANHIFQLMGSLDDMDSLILTEDNYFQFLTANVRKTVETKNAELNDDMADMLMRGSLASSALVLLGFRITDWDFRTLCHVLLDQNGGNSRKNKTHIAVQVDPEDGTHRDAVRARQYIERLFHEMLGRPLDSNVAVYWGSAEEFLEELDREWNKLRGE